MENIGFKLVTASEVELFEERLASFVDSMDRSDIIVDIYFSTTPLAAGGVEFSALVRYQRAEAWA